MLRIRRFQPSDAPEVLALHRRALAGTGADAGEGPWDDDLLRIEEVYLNSGGTFLVGLLIDQVVAMGALSLAGTDGAEVKRMRVDPLHQRQGYGQALLSALEEHAHQRGITRLFLDTGQVQEPAQRLYEKNGYARTGSGEVHGVACFFYEKRL